MSLVVGIKAQNIRFALDPETAQAEYAKQTPQLYGRCIDSLRANLDTIYIERLDMGEVEVVTQRDPYARYEFYLSGVLYRSIEIQFRYGMADTTWVDDPDIGPIPIVQESPVSIPNGAYHEFFPNGNIRIMGTLDGYNADGTLKKTGEWKEWDTNGNVVRRETYP